MISYRPIGSYPVENASYGINKRLKKIFGDVADMRQKADPSTDYNEEVKSLSEWFHTLPEEERITMKASSPGEIMKKVLSVNELEKYGMTEKSRLGLDRVKPELAKAPTTREEALRLVGEGEFQGKKIAYPRGAGASKALADIGMQVSAAKPKSLKDIQKGVEDIYAQQQARDLKTAGKMAEIKRTEKYPPAAPKPYVSIEQQRADKEEQRKYKEEQDRKKAEEKAKQSQEKENQANQRKIDATNSIISQAYEQIDSLSSPLMREGLLKRYPRNEYYSTLLNNALDRMIKDNKTKKIKPEDYFIKGTSPAVSVPEEKQAPTVDDQLTREEEEQIQNVKDNKANYLADQKAADAALIEELSKGRSPERVRKFMDRLHAEVK